MSKRQYWSAAVMIAWMGAIAGCGGGYEGGQRAEVKGRVSFDGVPVAQGALNLLPVDQGLSRVSGPITDGAYLIPEARGPNLGKYRVEIYGFEPLNTAPVGPEGDAEAASATRQIIPPQFNSKSTLEIDVNAVKMEQDYLLTTK